LNTYRRFAVLATAIAVVLAITTSTTPIRLQSVLAIPGPDYATTGPAAPPDGRDADPQSSERDACAANVLSAYLFIRF
jgi:hypothetical protein